MVRKRNGSGANGRWRMDMMVFILVIASADCAFTSVHNFHLYMACSGHDKSISTSTINLRFHVVSTSMLVMCRTKKARRKPRACKCYHMRNLLIFK